MNFTPQYYFLNKTLRIQRNFGGWKRSLILIPGTILWQKKEQLIPKKWLTNIFYRFFHIFTHGPHKKTPLRNLRDTFFTHAPWFRTRVYLRQLSLTILSEYIRLFMATILDNLKQLSLTILCNYLRLSETILS